jgi:hypothetical protein
MSLFLLEITTGTDDRDAATGALDRLANAAEAAGGEVLEAVVTGDHAKVFLVVSAAERDVAVKAARDSGLLFEGPSEVRLVGATEEEVRAARQEGARYLVEWDFPAGLTMDTYLERKKEKSPLYANVPEVSFLHTYVREDMSKCLCLYDASCEADVRKARDAVQTPITRLHELDGARSQAHAG